MTICFIFRFEPIVQGLLVRTHEQLRVYCMILINAIITTSDDLDYRIHIRNEIVRVGLQDIIEVIKIRLLNDIFN